MAQDARKPMFDLKPADGAIGSHAQLSFKPAPSNSDNWRTTLQNMWFATIRRVIKNNLAIVLRRDPAQALPHRVAPVERGFVKRSTFASLEVFG